MTIRARISTNAATIRPASSCSTFRRLEPTQPRPAHGNASSLRPVDSTPGRRHPWCVEPGRLRIRIRPQGMPGRRRGAGSISRCMDAGRMPMISAGVIIDNTGYNAWADTNHLIVLYPQTQSSPFLPVKSGGSAGTGGPMSIIRTPTSTKSGAQIMAIKAMLDALTAAAMPVPAAAPGAPGVAPERLIVGEHLRITVRRMAWSPVPGRDRAIAFGAPGPAPCSLLPAPSRAPSFGDSGLMPQSPYRWRVSAIVGGVESPASADAAGTTRSTPQPAKYRQLPDRPLRPAKYRGTIAAYVRTKKSLEGAHDGSLTRAVCGGRMMLLSIRTFGSRPATADGLGRATRERA